MGCSKRLLQIDTFYRISLRASVWLAINLSQKMTSTTHSSHHQQHSLSAGLLGKLSNKINKFPDPSKRENVFVITTLNCSVCEEEISKGDVIVIQGCKHGIHEACLLPTLKMQLGEGQTLMCCPFEGCKTRNLSQKFLRSILKPQDMKKFYRFLVALFIEAKQKEKCWQPCPQPDCKQIFKKSTQTRIQPGSWYRCNTSNQKFCLSCNRKSHPKFLDCGEYARSLDPNSQEYKILSYMQQNGYRQCPKCRRHVEKNEGCNHITCKCKFEFCYACEGPYPECNCPNVVQRRQRNR